ncbi:TauD/TfdA dioxygenase family protein [Nocardioides pocheonensis]|jgi:taurine dioxygenase|uniref:TauD/TfdA family dioxygenase n=1 Tax=Nocardioides pocheonensis TaxID=661485 RepID=A0A3N0GW53_9ACTN|nr:TauD/TfdA family dioxygenase [Nocardioides pocheonensis]RNM16671.1 TauD/TfdA family dioxygenase [Nocardioides pocheonensis]
MTLDLRKITAHIGARVLGVDPADDLSDDTVAELRAALGTHKALVLDAPDLDAAGQERFAARFGSLTAAHPTVPGGETPQVLDVDAAVSKANEWHSDVTFVVNPPAITTLRSITVPAYGGETLVASSAAAYRSLPEPLRRWADTLWAVHTNVYDYAEPRPRRTASEAAYREVFESTRYESSHPVVRVHPETGERGLFVGGFVRGIEGLSTTESRDVLRLLQAHVTRPEHVLRWSWQPGQLLVFDNRITQHYAIDNYDDQPRRLSRVTVGGDVPVSVSGQRSRALVGDSSHYSALPEEDVAA